MSDEFFNLPTSELLDLIKRDELHVTSEEQVRYSTGFYTETRPLQSLNLFQVHQHMGVLCYIKNE